MQLRLHPQEFLPLAFQHPLDRDSCPFCNDFGYVLRSDGFRDYRVLDGSLTSRQLINPGLRLRHLSITDLRHLAIISGSFRIMRQNLVVLHLLTTFLKL